MTLSTVRAVAGSLIIPSEYEENGNFFFTTANYQLPYYTQFNVNQSLLYVSAAELASFRSPAAVPITAAYFNPIAALPSYFSLPVIHEQRDERQPLRFRWQTG